MKRDRRLRAEGKLTPAQEVLMAPRLPEEDDLEKDPYEIANLPGVIEFWVREQGERYGTPESMAAIMPDETADLCTETVGPWP